MGCRTVASDCLIVKNRNNHGNDKRRNQARMTLGTATGVNDIPCFDDPYEKAWDAGCGISTLTK